VRIRSHTLASLVLGLPAVALLAGCGGGGGGGGFAQTSTTSQGGSQSGSSSGGNVTSGNTASGSTSAGSTPTGASSTSTSSGVATACAFPDGASPTGNFPFPQTNKFSRCTYPSSADPTLVCNAYKAWYNGITTTSGAGSNRRVYDKSFDSSNSTSEGIAYGMLIAVYMSDKLAFDAFWGYAQSHMSGGLMSWHIDPTGGTIDPHSATDADEDMAWSLIMADKQWGGSYLTAAKSMLGAIKSEFSASLPTDGDFSGASFTHPDYAAPDYSATFASVSGDSSWSSVSSAEYSAFSQHESSSGMIPDSLTNGNNFGFDACRAPWRTGVDYCWHGTASATSFLTPMISTFKSLASAATPFPGNLKLALSQQGQPVSGATVSGAAIGPAAVGAMMSSSNQAFIDSSWSFLTTYVKNAAIGGIYGASGDYFGDTLGMIGLLVLSGNFSDFTQ
jgi:hypothetical protein